ncbi:PAS domain S-box protein [soil metagenome]
MNQISKSSSDFVLFNGLANVLSDAVILVDPQTLCVQYINRVQNGFRYEDVIGADVFLFVFPEHTVKLKSIFDEIINKRKPVTAELMISNPLVKGEILWYRSDSTPIFNESNELVSILVITKDINESKNNEINIANKEEKLLAIINNTKDIILSIDQNLNLTEYNSVFEKAVERGYGKIELKGSCVLNYIDPKKHDHLRSIYSKVFNGEAIIDIENFETVTNIVVYNETGYNPIYTIDRKIIGISIFSKNITERIQNEKQLQKSLKERDLLLSEIHHRIKNNLALVSSMLHLKEMNLEEGNAKKALSDSRNRIKSTALVHEMLYRKDRFDAVSLQEFVSELFVNLRSSESIELILEGTDYILDLEKAFPFGLLMHELFMNSMKHSFDLNGKGRIKLDVKSENDLLSIEYCECSGKFPDSVDFNDTSTTGLMLIHTFMEQLNGKITLNNREPISYLINIPIN